MIRQSRNWSSFVRASDSHNLGQAGRDCGRRRPGRRAKRCRSSTTPPGTRRLSSRSGRAEMGRIRGGSRAQARRSARTTPAGSVSGAAGPARVHTQVRRAAAPARGCRPGRQNRPEGDCRSAKRDL